MNKKPFLVNKIKCGKNYTAGISNKGIPFIFGNKKYDKENRNININDDIIFFASKNYNYDLLAKDIYCGEEYLIILLEKEKLVIYSFNYGLFEIILNSSSDNNINYIISKINIVDKNFYILDQKNKFLFEYVYNNKSFTKPFNIYDFYQNIYEVNHDIKLSIIEMPFFVKFNFFWIECSENEKKDFSSQKKKMFFKYNEKNLYLNNNNKGPNINEFILFGNNKKKIELIKIEYENLFNKKERHYLLKGDYILSHQKNNEYKNNNININIGVNNVESSFQSLNIPVSKNYGNRNDAKEYNNNMLKYEIPRDNINKNDNNNNGGRKSVKHCEYHYNFNYGYKEHRTNYSISQGKKRSKLNNSEYEKENDEKGESSKKNEKKKLKYTKNTQTAIILDHNDINCNSNINNYISLTTNKIRENNSFLMTNKANINTNDNNKDNNEKYNYNYNHIPIKNSKRRSCSQIKEDITNNSNNNHNYHNTSTITTNANYSKKEENEFDNILKNINNRKILLNHPVKIESNTTTSKKFLAQIGKTKSKTEMLIKELNETFFGKDKNKNKINNNKTNNCYSNVSNNNNKLDVSQDESNEGEYNKEKINIKQREVKELLLKKEKEEKEEIEKRLEIENRIRKDMEEKEKKKREERIKLEKIKMENEKKEKEKERLERHKKEKEKLEKLEKEREMK